MSFVFFPRKSERLSYMETSMYSGRDKLESKVLPRQEFYIHNPVSTVGNCDFLTNLLFQPPSKVLQDNGSLDT